NMVIQSLVQPRFVGDSVGLSATVTFVALIFWAWVLGGLGALLAIPMTLLVKALLVDTDPRAAWVNDLIRSPDRTKKPDPTPAGASGTTSPTRRQRSEALPAAVDVGDR
ncbi:MAG TPA: AI-2E family transporter, partial [Pseudonocardia sp.]|nr:AI-2E family transporter [Pseudonocardia sp.]